MSDLYAVFGNPIAHSKSPDIHHAFAAQTQQNLVYEKRLPELGGFADAVQQLLADGGLGANVTVPFKHDAYDLVDELSDLAQRAGAVNTIEVIENGKLKGHNTDGLGLVRDLTVNIGVELKGKRVLLLGAGGAARGVMQPLLAEDTAKLIVSNRTKEKGLQLARDFGDCGFTCGTGFDELKDKPFDVIINATAASLSGDVPPINPGVIAAETVCYDMMYSNEPTAFLKWCAEQGATLLHDGLGMLVEQAAEAFAIWRGVRPDTQVVMAQMRP
ncbi:MAG: shikimate dehydrogenase [Gammaproteobacteria bacterium]|nr:shikimate dehydrogenase [Gammaproteobacteria bacterium]